jgi:hypothetical protein
VRKMAEVSVGNGGKRNEGVPKNEAVPCAICTCGYKEAYTNQALNKGFPS